MAGVMTSEGQCLPGGPLSGHGIKPPTKPVTYNAPTPFDRLAASIPAPVPSDPELRRWAARAGVDCPRSGRVPQRVKRLYLNWSSR